MFCNDDVRARKAVGSGREREHALFHSVLARVFLDLRRLYKLVSLVYLVLASRSS